MNALRKPTQCLCCEHDGVTPPLQLCHTCRQATERFLSLRHSNLTGKPYTLARKYLP